MSGTARVYFRWGDEIDPATNAPDTAATGTEASGAAAPTNGQQLRRKFRGFDSATDEGTFFVHVLPSNYVSGGSLTFDWSSNATSGNVIWKTGYALSTQGTTDFDGLAIGTVTAASAQACSATAGVEVTKTIDLGVTGATAGQKIYIYLGRDADNASDTVNANDAELAQPILFTYTTT